MYSLDRFHYNQNEDNAPTPIDNKYVGKPIIKTSLIAMEPVIMKSKYIMRTDLLKVSQETSTVDVLRLYKDITSSRLTYVTDDDGKLLGVVTIFDILQTILKDVVDSTDFYKKIESSELAMKYLAKSIGNTKDIPVQSIMRKNIETVSPEDFFLKAHKLLIKKDVTAMPVIDDKGRPIGEITRRIIIKYIAERL
jgi:CBS domain-containing protein